MLVALATSAALALLCGVAGLPVALVLRSSRDGYAALLNDSVVVGLTAGLLAVTLAIWGGPAACVAFVAAYLGLAAWGLYARRGTGLIPVARRPQAWALAAGAVVVAAMALRLRTVNVIPWTSDMGGYVNWANQFVRTGQFHSGFPPLFSVFLAVGAKLFGVSHNGSIVPLCGALLLCGVLRLLGQLRVAPFVRLLVVAVLAVQVHAVWFASFPASESLHAPLILAMFSLFVTALSARGIRFAVVLGALAIVTAALSLNRASAIVLAIPLLVLVVCCLAPSWARYSAAVCGAAAASLAGLFVGYAYGVQQIGPYYVTNQIEPSVPDRVYRQLADMGAFRLSAALLTAMAALLVVIAAAGYLLGRRPARPSRVHWPLPLTTLSVPIGAALVAEYSAGEVRDAIARIGWWLPAVAALAVCLPRAVRGARGVVAVLAASTAGIFLVLQISRFNGPLPHNIYLYWDRYLFSEFFPALVVLAALGAEAVYASARVRGRLQVARPVAAVAALACAAAYVPVTVRASSHVIFAGAYRFESKVNTAVSSAQNSALLWSASSPDPLPGVFPNSYYAFGVPLTYTFGRTVLARASDELIDTRAGIKPFMQDNVARGADISAAMNCEKTSAVYVVDVVKPSGAPLDQRMDGTPITLTLVADVSSRIELISQVGNPRWRTDTLRAQVWLASADAGSTPQRASIRCRVGRPAIR